MTNIRLLWCATAMSIWPLSAPLHADELTMETVLVTVPIHQAATETAFSADMVLSDELARQGATTLGDSIESLSGVHNATFGPGVGQPVIRGLSGPRVMALVNSTRSADVATFSADHSIAVEPLLADRIEVLRGPATLLYGGGAIGGVVNVIDGRIPQSIPEESYFALGARYQSVSDERNGVMRWDTALGDVAIHVDALTRQANSLKVPKGSGTDAGDRLPNTHLEAVSGTFGLSYQLARTLVGFAVNRLDNEYGLPEGAHVDAHCEEPAGAESDHLLEEEEAEHCDEHETEGHAADIRIDVEQLRYDLFASIEAPSRSIESVRAYLSTTDYRHAELEGAETGTLYKSDSTEARLEVVHEFSDWHGVIGIQASETEFAALGEEAFIPEVTTTRLGLFLMEDWHRDRWQIELGMRWDRDEHDPEIALPSRAFSSLSGSLGVIFEANEDWHLSLLLSSNERSPGTEELYSNVGNTDESTWVTHFAAGAIELGDLDLGTERSNSIELGFSYHTQALDARWNLYLNDFEDFIGLEDTGVTSEAVPIREYVQRGAELKGMEFEFDWLLLSRSEGSLSLKGQMDLVRGEFDSGQNISRLPPAMASAELQWRGARGQLFTKLTVADEQDRTGPFETPSDNWHRWDIGGEWHMALWQGDMTLYVSMTNVTDEEIRLSTSPLKLWAPEPGRSLNLGFRFER